MMPAAPEALAGWLPAPAAAWATPGERVLAIVPGFAADLNDAAIPSLRALLLELAAAGCAVQVLALRHPPGPRSYAVGPLAVETLGAGDARGLTRLQLLARARARAVAMAADADRVIGFWADEPGFLATEAGRARGIPADVALMGGELAALPGLGYGVGLQRLGRWLVAQALRRADRVSVGSAWLGARLELDPTWQHRTARDGAADYVVRPLPLEARYVAARAPLRPLPTGGAPLRLGCAANWVPVKRHATLLRWVARARAGGRDVRLRLAGEGPERAALQRLVRTLGIGDAVEFLGALEPAAMPAFYRGLDAHVLPSAWEAQGMASLEAMACGTPATGSRVGTLADLDLGHDDGALARWIGATAPRR